MRSHYHQQHHQPPLSCVPPPGETYLCIGQDLFSIDNYVREQYNYSLHLRRQDDQLNESMHSKTTRSSHRGEIYIHDYFPAAVMSYTDIQQLRGLEEPADYGSGIEFAGMLSDGDGNLLWNFDAKQDTTHTPALQLGLWLNGSRGCRDIVRGSLDDSVHRLFLFLTSRPHTTFLRVGYEFDNPSFAYMNANDSVDDSDDPALLFRQAFRYMVHYCESHFHHHCRRHVQFVWHSGAASESNLTAYYPGDDAVDWIGVSLFLQLLHADSKVVAANATGATATPSLNPMVQRVLGFAKAHNKPTMIAESTPFGGIDMLQDPWNSWFEPVLAVIEQYNVSMFCYISCDWESQPMWKGVGFGDSRLTTNATVMQLWRERVLLNSRFQPKGVSCESPSATTSESATTLLGQGDSSTLIAGISQQHMSRVTEDAIIGAFVVALVVFATALSVLVARLRPATPLESKRQRLRRNSSQPISYGSLHNDHNSGEG